MESAGTMSLDPPSSPPAESRGRSPAPAGPESGAEGERSAGRLPLWLRVLVLLAGWLVVLAGIAQILLPGPGALTILAGAAILSVASELVYRIMHRLFHHWPLHRWPGLWTRLERFRERVRERLQRFSRG